jgi:hypothetical protein
LNARRLPLISRRFSSPLEEKRRQLPDPKLQNKKLTMASSMIDDPENEQPFLAP